MNNIYKKIKSDRRGVAIIMITILIMASILTAALSLGSVVINGLRVSNVQQNATQSYFAAEAGAERALYETRKNGFEPENVGCITNDYFEETSFNSCVTAQADGEFLLSTDGLKYYVEYATTSTSTILNSFGEYKGTRRAVKISY